MRADRSDDKTTILLIDDEENLLITLSDFLEFEGYDVVQARTAEEGIDSIRQKTPHLIILDMRLPGMGGEEFLKRFVREDGSLPWKVLVLSARTMPPGFFDDIHVAGVLAKPCELAEVAQRVRSIVT